MSTESADGPLNGEFSRLVQETLEMWHVPGVAVAVVDGDKTWTKVGACL
jgi:CubicO group peptidase (beta-lactamase class C family)